MNDADRSVLPPVQTTIDGKSRRCGIGIEFIGVEPAEAARIVASTVQGEVNKMSECEYKMTGDSAGAWKVERDSALKQS
ncbi:MAG: amidoligase family protein [Gammaproteobacteria bacterium]|nr:amidoligase family protein [Gammaproteobacteria bacterium]